MRVIRALSAVAAVVLLAVALAGCTATVRGKVTSDTTGKAIKGATVFVGTQSAKTGSDGSFVLSGVDSKATELRLVVEGFSPQIVSIVGGIESPQLVTLDDASVVIHLAETAAEPAVPTGAVVACGNTTMSPDARGQIRLNGQEPGHLTLHITGPIYEAETTAIELKAGSNEATVSISLTPTETYRRFSDAQKFNRYAVAWLYLHADTQAYHKSIQNYTDPKNNPGTYVSMTMGQSRILPTWTSTTTHKTYSNVVEIDRTVVTEYLGQTITDNNAQHWVEVNGFWQLVYQ
jgi:hypothetical protein